MRHFETLKEFVKSNKPDKEEELTTLLSEYESFEKEVKAKNYVKALIDMGISRNQMINYYTELAI